MFVVGNGVKGGHYGEVPSLTKLAEGDNLAYTTDFRRVYQTFDKWMARAWREPRHSSWRI